MTVTTNNNYSGCLISLFIYFVFNIEWMKFSENSMFSEDVDLNTSHWIRILSNKSIPVSFKKVERQVVLYYGIVDMKKKQRTDKCIWLDEFTTLHFLELLLLMKAICKIICNIFDISWRQQVYHEHRAYFLHLVLLQLSLIFKYCIVRALLYNYIFTNHLSSVESLDINL